MFQNFIAYVKCAFLKKLKLSTTCNKWSLSLDICFYLDLSAILCDSWFSASLVLMLSIKDRLVNQIFIMGHLCLIGPLWKPYTSSQSFHQLFSQCECTYFSFMLLKAVIKFNILIFIRKGAKYLQSILRCLMISLNSISVFNLSPTFLDVMMP